MKLKKAIRLKEITKIKHNKKNNYIGICTLKLEEEIMETFKKEEIVLFINRKLKKLGKDLKNKEKEDKKIKNQIFEPANMFKYKPYFLESFALASKNKDIGYITININKIFNIMSSENEFLTILTDYGLVFFKSTNFDLVDFLPIVGVVFKRPETEDSLFIVMVFSDESEKVLRFHSVLERDSWYRKLVDRSKVSK